MAHPSVTAFLAVSRSYGIIQPEIIQIVNAYSLLVGLGASLGLLRVVQNVPRWQAQRWANAGLLALLGGLIGARFVYISIHWLYFKNHLFEIFALWNGGYSWPGAVLGGAAAVLLIAWRWHVSPGKIADRLAPMLPPLVVSIWLGCWLAGFAYGPTAPDDAFWGVPCRDVYGALALRFPLQFSAAAAILLYSFWLETRKFRDSTDGWQALLMILGVLMDLLIFTALRTDPTPTWQGLRLDTWAALLLLACCLAVLIGTYFRFKIAHAIKQK